MIMIGAYYESNNYGKVKVLSKDSRPNYYVVRFLETGTIKAFRSCQIESGCIRDPFAKSVCGVACTGDVKTRGFYKPYYSIWHDMINRCYNPKDKRFNAYKNVTVSDDWLVFENFINDLPFIDGFNPKLIEEGKLSLDKDIKQHNNPNKIYSKETCLWVDRQLNSSIQDSQQKAFLAISPEGKTFKANNITRFAREHGLDRRHISGILHGRAHTTKGWTFSYEEIV